MTKKTKPEETTPPPAEFSAFVRRIGINSFDRFAEKKSGSRSGAKAGNPLKALADLWLGLTPKEKERFFDQVIAAGQAAAVAAPAVLAMAKAKAAKKSAETPDKADASSTEEKKKEKKSKKKKSGKDSDEKKPKKAKKKD